MANFINLIDECIATCKSVGISVGDNAYFSGIIRARGDDYIEVEGEYGTRTFIIDKIVSI
jgi:hypothetical protein